MFRSNIYQNPLVLKCTVADFDFFFLFCVVIIFMVVGVFIAKKHRAFDCILENEGKRRHLI